MTVHSSVTDNLEALTPAIAVVKTAPNLRAVVELMAVFMQAGMEAAVAQTEPARTPELMQAVVAMFGLFDEILKGVRRAEGEALTLNETVLQLETALQQANATIASLTSQIVDLQAQLEAQP